jgi:hypothetical protein
MLIQPGRYELARAAELKGANPSAAQQNVGTRVILPASEDVMEGQFLCKKDISSVAYERTAEQEGYRHGSYLQGTAFLSRESPTDSDSKTIERESGIEMASLRSMMATAAAAADPPLHCRPALMPSSVLRWRRSFA